MDIKEIKIGKKYLFKVGGVIILPPRTGSPRTYSPAHQW